jgi:uncharacterized protein YecE (DUF72 family)
VTVRVVNGVRFEQLRLFDLDPVTPVRRRRPAPPRVEPILDAAALTPAAPLRVGATIVRVGTCSWADTTLTKDTDWYPKRSMKAGERLSWYASRFPIVEADATYYFPPTPELVRSWVERSPDGFVFDVKAWSLMTGHPTRPHSLWEDLQGEVRPEHRDKKNLYADHLSTEAVAECTRRFRHALLPLHETGKLGGVLLQWPRWFGPSESHRDEIVGLVEALDPLPCIVEFRQAAWLSGEQTVMTLEFLEDYALPYVCVDEPQGFASSVPPVLATTAPLGVIRMHGHNAENWERRGITAAERFRYLYSEEELQAWSPRLRGLAGACEELHVLWNNCWRDHAVSNAARMVELLGIDG